MRRRCLAGAWLHDQDRGQRPLVLCRQGTPRPPAAPPAPAWCCGLVWGVCGRVSPAQAQGASCSARGSGAQQRAHAAARCALCTALGPPRLTPHFSVDPTAHLAQAGVTRAPGANKSFRSRQFRRRKASADRDCVPQAFQGVRRPLPATVWGVARGCRQLRPRCAASWGSVRSISPAAATRLFLQTAHHALVRPHRRQRDPPASAHAWRARPRRPAQLRPVQGHR